MLVERGIITKAGLADLKRPLKEKIDDGLGTAKILLNLAAMNQKQLAPLVGMVTSNFCRKVLFQVSPTFPPSNGLR